MGKSNAIFCINLSETLKLDMYIKADFHVGIGIGIELLSQYLSYLKSNRHEIFKLSLSY